jgi:hypothetical protein
MIQIEIYLILAYAIAEHFQTELIVHVIRKNNDFYINRAYIFLIFIHFPFQYFQLFIYFKI